MEYKQQKKHWLIRALLWLTVAVVFLVVILPLWFPWLMMPVARQYGLGFTHYERVGWTRFALTRVHMAWNHTQLDVERIESVLPTTWLWQRILDRTNSPLLSLDNGQLKINAPTNSLNSLPVSSTIEALDQISRIGMLLHRWLPAADLANFTIMADTNRVSVPHAQWREGQLRAVFLPPSSHEEAELVCRFDRDSVLELSAIVKEFDASLHGAFTRGTEGWRWEGDLSWLTNHANLTAQFATNSWWPLKAQVDCQDWQVPTHFLPIQGYDKLMASLTANLVSNRFALQATGFAQPSEKSAQLGFPTVRFSLGADGDPSEVKLHHLNIQLPWLRADLTNSVEIIQTRALLTGPAQIDVTMNLDKLPGAGLTGKAAGVLQIEPREGQLPVVKFRLSANQVRAGPLDSKAATIRGEFADSILKIDEIRADFADGSVLAANGSFDELTRLIVDARWQMSGGFLKSLPGFHCAASAASGEFHGALTHLQHSGEAAFTNCQTAGLKPYDLRVKWNGTNQHLAVAEVEWSAGASVLSINGTADLDVSERKVATTLTHLSLHHGKDELYALQQPCTIAFATGKTNGPGQHWSLNVDAFHWQSEHREVFGTANLAWPSSGEATLALTNFAFAAFSDFVAADIGNILLAELTATAHWSNGPVHSVIHATGSMTNSSSEMFGLRGNVKTDEVLMIEQLDLESRRIPALSFTGTVPVKFIPDRADGMLVWDKSENIALVGDWKEGTLETFAIPLGARGQLDVTRPELHLRISGTPFEPSASLVAGATRLAWPSKTNITMIPRLEDLQLAVEIRPDAIRLNTFTARLDGQPITTSGEWPISGKGWRELWSAGKRPDWDQAQGHLKLESAQVAAFATYLPKLLSPEGLLNATLELKAGKRFEGTVSLTNAATLPMGRVAPLRNITALVRLDGNRAVLEDFHGGIGGQQVRADGFVTIPNLDGSGLDYHVNLHGTNVPLARSPELLLRGDLDIMLQGGSDGAPLLSGTVTLRDGLYVQHASALVWSAPRRPEWRPPYFRMTNEIFADWRLQMIVHGDRFLRIRTPVFSGVASADFQLKGSLLSPLLTGDARISSGHIMFPFGSLNIDQGFASFSGNDPNGPNLQLNATGRNYRYDLRLEVKGPADGANVILSATPPLTSEQILLMLTAGEIPQSDYTFSNSARAGRLGTFLGKDLLSLYMGSDPAEERLIIRSGENISQDGQLSYSVEYRLSNRWSIVGEYDEFNAFNTDLKWILFTH